MNKRNQLTIGLIVAIFMLACACPVSGLIPGGNGDSGEPTPGLPFVPVTEEPQIEIPDIPGIPANVIYSDDFSGESVEMETYSSDTGSAGVQNGVYVVIAQGDFWEWGRSDSEFTDTVVDVDATVVAGPSNNNNGFGVYCRVVQAEDGSIDGYLLGISADGFYTIQHFTPEEFTPLVEWTKSGAIKQGNQTNHIRATCSGSELKLEVNGTVVGTATTPAGGPASGAISLVATSFETTEPYTEVHFDNLVISQP
jgi:hypothetical protein